MAARVSFFRQARARRARSRAVEQCPSAFRPLGLAKRLCSMPSRAARRFICATKFSTVPPQCRATARAASLPDWSSSPYSRVSSRSSSPGLR